MNDDTIRAAPDGPSDDELRALGLQPVRTWARKAETGKASRNRRHRAKAAAQGRRQLSVVVPEQDRETVREVSKRLCAGRLRGTDVEALLRDGAPTGRPRPNGREAGRRRPDRGRLVRLTAAAAIVFAVGFLAGLLAV